MIVFTNGCFDLLHAGHADLLAQCRDFAGPAGSVVVGLNTDESVRRIKGPDRPIVPERERKAMLEALDTVDHVFLFTSEEDLRTLIHSLLPDVICKGEECRGKPITGSEIVPVKLLPRRIELSTTAIVGRLMTSLGSPDKVREFANRGGHRPGRAVASHLRGVPPAERELREPRTVAEEQELGRVLRERTALVRQARGQ